MLHLDGIRVFFGMLLAAKPFAVLEGSIFLYKRLNAVWKLALLGVKHVVLVIALPGTEALHNKGQSDEW